MAQGKTEKAESIDGIVIPLAEVVRRQDSKVGY